MEKDIYHRQVAVVEEGSREGIKEQMEQGGVSREQL